MTITSLHCILLLPFRVNENYRVYIHKCGIGIATFRLSPLCELASLQEQESVPSVIGWKHLHCAGIVPQLVDSRRRQTSPEGDILYGSGSPGGVRKSTSEYSMGGAPSATLEAWTISKILSDT
jgi:hypothetical protein